MALKLDTRFDPAYGSAVPAGGGVAKNAARITAPNPSPLTIDCGTVQVGLKTTAVDAPAADAEANKG